MTSVAASPALQWVVDGYTLMFGALLLSAGALTDRGWT
jgi:MFS transporter, DHA2 family, methylenomycin A resistance protein